MGEAASAQPKVAHTPPSYPVLYGKLGRLVKAFFPVARIIILTSMVGGCTAGLRNADLGNPLQSGEVMAINGLEGRWAGPVVSADQNCGGTTTGLMSIGGGSFGFDPFQSTTVIRGTVNDAGQLAGTLTRAGGSGKTLSISFEGHAEKSPSAVAIRGELSSASCHWTVTLKRS